MRRHCENKRRKWMSRAYVRIRRKQVEVWKFVLQKQRSQFVSFLSLHGHHMLFLRWLEVRIYIIKKLYIKYIKDKICFKTIWHLKKAFGDQTLLTPGVTMIPACTCKFVACLDPYVYAISHPRYRIELQKKLPWLAITEKDVETSSTATETTTPAQVTAT